ncbi:MAG TPA: glycoside hydrolase family 2 TIM barrel-domain containing protein [Flavisolibacter sp.]|nr:glycoside hydrolase family 2 TIM barrel-domain containing protein [Flavisolibacter sp.]
MKKKNIVFQVSFLLLLISTTAFAQGDIHHRIAVPVKGVQKVDLNGTWHFSVAQGELEPASATSKDIDAKAKEIAGKRTSSWANVQVPQFLNRISWWLPDVSKEYEQQEIDRVAKLPEGATTAQAGWYSKIITFPKGAEGKEVYANFEGVALVSRVYINGVNVGQHLGMFGSFKCRLTPHLKSGEDNQLLVYVERGVKSKDGDKLISVEVSVPVTQNMLLSLNKSMYDKIGPKYNVMGIWLPVTLEVSEEGGRIADVFFNPSLDGHTMEFTMQNPDANKSIAGKLSYTITNKKTGKVLATETVNPSLKLSPKESNTFTINKKGLKPELWSPDMPNLYIMDVKWTSPGGKLIHQWKEQVGYRTITTQGAQVILNGKPYWSRGANMPPYGYKPNDEQVARGFLKLMHDGNTVITRSHGNPWNHMWFTAADEIGIGVSCEGGTWALLAKDIPPVGNLAAWKQEQLEIVKQYRNHPSILFYVVSNEGLAQGDDYKNEEKLTIYKDIITDMRKVDNSRLIFQTSGNPDYWKIADIEDTHAYWDWYWSSSYVNDYTKPGHGLPHNDRPFMNQEAAVPYSMIDDGSVHPSYIPRYCAQPWVGDRGVFGGDYSYFQEHIRAVSKLKAEKLRYSRAQLPTAGVMLFSNVTWIQHALSKPVNQWKPFPVYNSVKEAYTPVLAGLINTQYVFYSGDKISTELFIVNDDNRFRSLKNLKAVVSIKDANGKSNSKASVAVGDVNYYDIKRTPVTFTIPSIKGAQINSEIHVTLLDGKKTISHNTYPIRIIKKETATTGADKTQLVAVSNVANPVVQYLKSAGVTVVELGDVKGHADVIILGSADSKTTKVTLDQKLKPGGRVIVLDQGERAHRLCKEVILSFDEASGTIKDPTPNREQTIQPVRGEFVEMLDYDTRGALYKGLQPMDWKWWSNGSGNPAYVTHASHKIKADKNNVIPIGRYLEPHAYWSGNLDEVYKQKIGYPVFAVNYPWGQLVVCDLIIEKTIDKDPRSGQTLMNLLTAEIKK